MKRIADFTLGQYRRTASPADLAAFEGAFQNYAIAVYQSYFTKYAGQTLKVTGSQARTPDDFIVATQLIDPNDHSGQQPLEVDFRVRTDTGKPVVVDFSRRRHLAGAGGARSVHRIPGPEQRQHSDADVASGRVWPSNFAMAEKRFAAANKIRSSMASRL